MEKAKKNMQPIWLLFVGVALVGFLVGLVAGGVLGPLAILVFLVMNWIFSFSSERNGSLMAFIVSSAGILGVCASILLMGWSPREVLPVIMIVIGYLPYGWQLARK